MTQMTRPEDAPIHFQAAWNAHDMEALGALFHPDARFVNRFGRYVEGVEAIVAMHAPIHATVYRDSVMANELIDVLPIGDTAAVVHFWSRLTMGEAHPAGPHTVDTVILAVLTAGEGRWKFHAFENVTLVDPRTGQAVLRSEGQAVASRKAGR